MPSTAGVHVSYILMLVIAAETTVWCLASTEGFRSDGHLTVDLDARIQNLGASSPTSFQTARMNDELLAPEDDSWMKHEAFRLKSLEPAVPISREASPRPAASPHGHRQLLHARGDSSESPTSDSPNDADQAGLADGEAAANANEGLYINEGTKRRDGEAESSASAEASSDASNTASGSSEGSASTVMIVLVGAGILVLLAAAFISYRYLGASMPREGPSKRVNSEGGEVLPDLTDSWDSRSSQESNNESNSDSEHDSDDGKAASPQWSMPEFIPKTEKKAAPGGVLDPPSTEIKAVDVIPTPDPKAQSRFAMCMSGAGSSLAMSCMQRNTTKVSLQVSDPMGLELPKAETPRLGPQTPPDQAAAPPKHDTPKLAPLDEDAVTLEVSELPALLLERMEWEFGDGVSMEVPLQDPALLANWRESNGRVKYHEGVHMKESIIYLATPGTPVEVTVTNRTYIRGLCVECQTHKIEHDAEGKPPATAKLLGYTCNGQARYEAFVSECDLPGWMLRGNYSTQYELSSGDKVLATWDEDISIGPEWDERVLSGKVGGAK